MSLVSTEDVKNCQRCDASLERGHSARWSGDELKEVICFDCSNNEEFKEYIDTKVLTTHLVTNNWMKLFYLLETNREPKRVSISNQNELRDLRYRLDIQIAILDIQKKIKEFETKIWFGGLQEIVRASTVKGVSAKTEKDENFCVLTYSMCGRTMFTIEDDLGSITLITDETSKDPCMGLQGIRANVGYATYLLNFAIEKWENKTLKFKDDSKVGIF